MKRTDYRIRPQEPSLEPPDDDETDEDDLRAIDHAEILAENAHREDYFREGR